MAAPYLTIEEQYQDPHHRERQSYVEVKHPIAGTEVLYGIPWKLSETPGGIHRSGNLLGEHNDYLFRELLSLSRENFNQLVEEKVIY